MPTRQRTLPTAAARASLIAAAAVLVAIPAIPAGAQAPGTRAVLPGYATPVLLDTLGVASAVAGNRDSLYVALFKTFEELEIPVEGQKREGALVQNTNLIRTKKLGGQNLSRYFDCGQGFSRPNADFYRIVMAVSAWLEPATGAPATLKVAAAASGQDPAGSRTGWVVCTSTGKLEERITARVGQLAPKG